MGPEGLLDQYDEFVQNDPYYAATIMSYVPILGTLMDTREAVKNPTAENIGYAALSGITDLIGGRIFAKLGSNALKARKAYKTAKKAEYEYWKNTPFYNSMPKKRTERTIRNYAEIAGNKAYDNVRNYGYGLDMPFADMTGASSVYLPDFLANMNQHKIFPRK